MQLRTHLINCIEGCLPVEPVIIPMAQATAAAEPKKVAKEESKAQSTAAAEAKNEMAAGTASVTAREGAHSHTFVARTPIGTDIEVDVGKTGLIASVHIAGISETGQAREMGLDHLVGMELVAIGDTKVEGLMAEELGAKMRSRPVTCHYEPTRPRLSPEPMQMQPSSWTFVAATPIGTSVEVDVSASGAVISVHVTGIEETGQAREMGLDHLVGMQLVAIGDTKVEGLMAEELGAKMQSRPVTCHYAPR